MDDQRNAPAKKVAAAERDEKRTLLAVGVIVLWLATMLLVAGTPAARGLF